MGGCLSSVAVISLAIPFSRQHHHSLPPAPGRIFGGFQCIAGMMVIALPATVLQANFYEIYR